MAGIKVASFGAGLIDLFLSLETRIGCPSATTMEGTGACVAFTVFVVDLMSGDASVSTAPAVALTVLAGVGFADET